MAKSINNPISFDVEFRAAASIQVDREVFDAWMEENEFDEDDDPDYVQEMFIQDNFRVGTFHRDYSGQTSYLSVCCNEEFGHKIYHESFEEGLLLVKPELAHNNHPTFPTSSNGGDRIKNR